MTARKIVLHSRRGYDPQLETLVSTWIDRGVKYVGVVGVDAARIEDAIDLLSIARGPEAFVLTASHEPPETLLDAVELATHIDTVEGEALCGDVDIVEF
jgi:hypothetical protein